jgi:uncharacterized membrane protein YuzA (DUF378 family)
MLGLARVIFAVGLLAVGYLSFLGARYVHKALGLNQYDADIPYIMAGFAALICLVAALVLGEMGAEAIAAPHLTLLEMLS